MSRTHRATGTLGEARGVLWATILALEGRLVHHEHLPLSDVTRICHAISQAVGQYCKLVEGTEHEARLEALERRAA